MKIMGYRRKNGQIGIRNHIVVLPASICASEVATKISNNVDGSIALSHQHGCCQMGDDYEQTLRTLSGLGRNPNVAAVLVVGLGCESIKIDNLVYDIRKTEKIVTSLNIQESGDSLKAIKEGIKLLMEMKESIVDMQRQKVDIKELIVGLECGGSDATSGITSNPAVGVASDKLISFGGTVILSETTELIGAEHIIAKRTSNKSVGNSLKKKVKKMEKQAVSSGLDIRGCQPTPGNIRGGLTTIEEKSLGCIYKAGSTPIQEVLEYGQSPSVTGLCFMDTPGQDIESITGMLAGGAQIIVFTTGLGTPTGAPIAPVIKITGNSQTYNKMKVNIDINAGKIIDDAIPIKKVGEEIITEIISVCNGKLTKAERHKHREFAISRIGVTF
ncbi:MAG: UxaA family hydrolase [bacterium]